MGRRLLFDSLLSVFGFNTYRTTSQGEFDAIRTLAKKRKADISHEIAMQLNYEVQRGPFKGLKLPEAGAWSDHDIALKLIGSYECEIFETLEDVYQQNISTVINIGASEGYYAIGIKRMLPNISGYTFDIDKNSFAALEYCQSINDVDVTKLDEFNFAEPYKVLSQECQSAPLFIVDCEGCEKEITSMPHEAFSKAIFLIELHDFAAPNIESVLIEFLQATHDIKVFHQKSRDIYAYPEIKHLNDLEKMLLLYEGRENKTNCLYAKPHHN